MEDPKPELVVEEDYVEGTETPKHDTTEARGVIGDGAHSDEEEPGAPKENRRRLATIGAYVKHFCVVFHREDHGHLRQLSRPEIIDKMVKDLDDMWVAKNETRFTQSQGKKDGDVSNHDVSEAYPVRESRQLLESMG